MKGQSEMQMLLLLPSSEWPVAMVQARVKKKEIKRIELFEAIQCPFTQLLFAI